MVVVVVKLNTTTNNKIIIVISVIVVVVVVVVFSLHAQRMCNVPCKGPQNISHHLVQHISKAHCYIFQDGFFISESVSFSVNFPKEVISVLKTLTLHYANTVVKCKDIYKEKKAKYSAI